MTRVETTRIMSAVIRTFCRGRRRPRENKLVTAAKKNRRPSIQRQRAGNSICKQSNATLQNQKTRNTMNKGLCQRAKSGEGRTTTGSDPAAAGAKHLASVLEVSTTRGA